jgi:hypothetical protein
VLFGFSILSRANSFHKVYPAINLYDSAKRAESPKEERIEKSIDLLGVMVTSSDGLASAAGYFSRCKFIPLNETRDS